MFHLYFGARCVAKHRKPMMHKTRRSSNWTKSALQSWGTSSPFCRLFTFLPPVHRVAACSPSCRLFTVLPPAYRFFCLFAVLSSVQCVVPVRRVSACCNCASPLQFGPTMPVHRFVACSLLCRLLTVLPPVHRVVTCLQFTVLMPVHRFAAWSHLRRLFTVLPPAYRFFVCSPFCRLFNVLCLLTVFPPAVTVLRHCDLDLPCLGKICPQMATLVHKVDKYKPNKDNCSKIAIARRKSKDDGSQGLLLARILTWKSRSPGIVHQRMTNISAEAYVRLQRLVCQETIMNAWLIIHQRMQTITWKGCLCRIR